MIHTCSLEVSRKIKEAGIEIKTEWFWYKGGYSYNKWILVNEKPITDVCEFFPAPTLGELIRELPEEYVITRYGEIWRCWEEIAPTPEDAVGLMLIKVKQK